MSVMTINLTAVSSRRPPKWRKLLAELRQRARTRYDVRTLADCEILDLGRTPTDARYKTDKPFRHG